MTASRSATVVAYMVLLFTQPLEGIFLSKVDNVRGEVSEKLDPTTHATLLRNGIHAEIIGEVAPKEMECGLVLLDYSGYTDGSLFDAITKSLEEGLMSNMSGPTISQKVYGSLKEKARVAHRLEMKDLFAKYSSITRSYVPEDLQFIPFAGVAAGIAGLVIGGLAWHGAESIWRYLFGPSEQEPYSEIEVLAGLVGQLKTAVIAVDSSIKYGLAFDVIRRELRRAVRSTLDELFNSGKVSPALLNKRDNGNGLWSSIKTLMGSKFNSSLFERYGEAAANPMEVTVIAMSNRVMQLQVCYPIAKLSDVAYLMRVLPLGQFSEDNTTFWTHDVGGYYAMEKGTVSDVGQLQLVEECERMGPVHLCSMSTQRSGCGLRLTDRDRCAFFQHNATNKQFTLVRKILRSVIIATKAQTMFLLPMAEQVIDVEHQVFVAEIQRGRTLVVGSQRIPSPIVSGTLSLDIDVIAPDVRPEFSPDAVPSAVQTGLHLKVSQHGTWLAVTLLYLMMGAAVVYEVTVRRRQMDRMKEMIERSQMYSIGTPVSTYR